LLLKAEPSRPSGDVVTLMDDVQEVRRDGVENPRHDHAVHARPGRVVEARGIAEDVILEREPTEDEEDIASPLGVVGRLEVQNDRNQVPDVLDGGGLAVQASNSHSVGDGVIVAGQGVVVGDEVRAEALPESGRLLLQGVGQRALLLKGVSRARTQS